MYELLKSNEMEIVRKILTRKNIQNTQDMKLTDEELKTMLTDEEALVWKKLLEGMGDNLRKVNTIEQFYDWRDSIKTKSEEHIQNSDEEFFLKDVRNLIIENTIAYVDNKGHGDLTDWSLIYDYTKFQRIITSARANLFNRKRKSSQRNYLTPKDLETFKINVVGAIYDYLNQKNFTGENVKRLFDQSRTIGKKPTIEVPRFNTVFEFVNCLIKEDELPASWPIYVLETCLEACQIDGNTLLDAARDYENKVNVFITEIDAREEIAMLEQKNPAYVYTKK